MVQDISVPQGDAQACVLLLDMRHFRCLLLMGNASFYCRQIFNPVESYVGLKCTNQGDLELVQGRIWGASNSIRHINQKLVFL